VKLIKSRKAGLVLGILVVLSLFTAGIYSRKDYDFIFAKVQFDKVKVVGVPSHIKSASILRNSEESSVNSLNVLLNASERFSKLKQKIFSNEKKGMSHIQPRRGNGSQLIVILPPSSQQFEEFNLRREVTSIIDELVLIENIKVTDKIKTAVVGTCVEWLNPSRNYKAITVHFEGDLESPVGLVMEIKNPSQIIDKIQYIDYGPEIESKRLTSNELQDRYGHLYSSDWSN
jgi:hypothetical protein